MKIQRSDEITLNQYQFDEENKEWNFQPRAEFFAHHESKSGFAVYASHAAAKGESVQFTVRREMDITRFDTITFRGEHYMITVVEETSDDGYLLRCVKVTPVRCVVTETTYEKDGYNTPYPASERLICFYAYLAEKYVKFQQLEPQPTNETLLVLITPNEIILNTGTRVTVTGQDYSVKVSHLLDEYHNEYEIHAKEDVTHAEH